ncbi:MAG: hypothetical protein DYG93_04580 [Leptolyngbya sp. PLA2]|nr:hypothetical protein [Leptolyngbya sp.]MCE7970924.1 hypothetical protein [Leptolyngbya sp. PL-A2]MCQ3940261.1 hypothetical protein [cyanobacterium CYA1]MCZ7633766.1 M12 family metallo-peptidase [Phycisphaerales bacterium]MDL1904669.1 hypothetical protein [Synechococcales cyanobacterium CNB]GIK20421.1 MAG: hypothetical protein BroJett004_25850 [Planctomycetota bacterium]
MAYRGPAWLAGCTAAFLIFAWMSPSQSRGQTLSGSAPVATYTFDDAALDGRAGGPIVVRDFPLGASGRRADLLLTRLSVTTPWTRFAVGRAGEADSPLNFDPSSVTLLRGTVVGQPGSHAFIALGANAANGYLEVAGERFGVSSRLPGGGATRPGEVSVFAVRPGGTLLPPGVEFCRVVRHNQEPMPDTRSTPDQPSNLYRIIELAIETDYEYFLLFGDLDAAAEYVVTLYGAVSDIYLREMNLRFELTYVRLWDNRNDLYQGNENPLGAFRNHWNNNMQHIPRDTAQYLSARRYLSAGGVAYLSALCTNNGYSWAGYTLGFFVDPDRPHVFNRDVVVPAHELGHNCGTLHTHDYGVDNCANDTPIPSRGDMMSYCAQTVSGGEANIDMRFHRLTRRAMHEHVATRDCLTFDCNLNGIPDSEEIALGLAQDANADGIPDDCQDCNRNGILDPEEIALGLAEDANGNLIPDRCEPDCNANGLPDAWDTYTGLETDSDGDTIPDACQSDCDADGVYDYAAIQANMPLDIDRDGILDACQDCDGDGIIDLLALDAAHFCFVTSLTQPAIRSCHSVTGVVAAVSPPAVNAGHDLVITPDRRVLVSSGADHRVVEFDRSGALVGDFVPSGAGGLSTPTGMVVTPRGTLLVASLDTASVHEFDLATGQHLGELVAPGSGGLVSPWGMTLSPSGTLVVAAGNNRVREYDASTGEFLRTVVTSNNGGLNQPRGIVYNPITGDLLVASYGNNRILAYDGATGAPKGKWNQGGTSTVLTLEEPWGLRVGPDGGVYASTSHVHRDTGGLHVTRARVYHFDPRNGYFMRAFIVGNDTDIWRPSGFDFMPDAGTDCNLNGIPDDCEIADGRAQDCNTNGLPDSCDIAAGRSQDLNRDGIPDECQCLADFNRDDNVDSIDLVAFLNTWVTGDQAADFNGDGVVNSIDVAVFLNLWIAGC